jgi:UDP-glucose 4-epimerase
MDRCGNMKILVTGGAGFIGSNIANELAKDNEVVVADNFFLGRKDNLEKNIIVKKCDILDRKKIFSLCKDIDFIFHQAAASSSPMFLKNLNEAVSVNVNGFINILDAARKNDVKRVIYASTSSIYGNIKGPLREDMKTIPPNFYAASKLMDEFIADIYYKEYGLESIGLRYMSVYGPNEKGKGLFANMVSQFLWSMQKGKRPVIYGDGKQTRDFVFVKDVVQANILAMKKKKIGHEIFNVGTGRATTLNELVKILNKILGKNIKPLYVKNPVKNYIYTQLADITKIKKMLGYQPRYSLEDGIKYILNS